MRSYYKLHGSVDWTISGQKELSRVDGPIFKYPAIAAPGPAKKIACDSHFARIWNAALEAIKVADAVVFVGYRFPPSDSESLRRLTDALKQNRRPGPPGAHIVLGPNTGHEDIVRLRGLLTHVISNGARTQIDVHPFFAQDYFTVVGRPYTASRP